jgi:drug/metabolite transporter (DMT)-like permease
MVVKRQSYFLNKIAFLSKTRTIHFFIVGISAILLQILLTYLYTTYINNGNFTQASFYIPSIIIMIYNFFFHTIFTYRTHTNHISRFIKYALYYIIMTFIIQAQTIFYMISVIGTAYYILINAVVVFTYAILSHIIFKLWLFNDAKVNIRIPNL